MIGAIQEMARKRDALMRAEGNLTRQIKSQCRRAAGISPADKGPEKSRKEALAKAMYEAVQEDAKAADGVDQALLAGLSVIVSGLLAAREVVSTEHKQALKDLAAYAKTTHVAQFVESTPGFGYVGLGQIVGATGDLSNYPNPAKLWKRLGLGLISSGERQRKFTDARKAAEAGYSPTRRSMMFTLGDSLVKCKGPYRELYLQRKAIEQDKAPDGTKMLWHRRAQRYMEKRLLRELWRAWNGRTEEIQQAGGQHSVDAHVLDAAVPVEPKAGRTET